MYKNGIHACLEISRKTSSTLKTDKKSEATITIGLVKRLIQNKKINIT